MSYWDDRNYINLHNVARIDTTEYKDENGVICRLRLYGHITGEYGINLYFSGSCKYVMSKFMQAIKKNETITRQDIVEKT